MIETELGKAFDKLQEDDKKTIKKFYTTVKRPSKKFLIKDFNIPQTRAVKCTEKKLSKVLAFIDSKKRNRFADGFTVMSIACTSKTMKALCGSEMNVSNFIKYMKIIGLLANYDKTYRFNSDRFNRSKSYVYSKEAEDKIKEYCEMNSIKKYKVVYNGSKKNKKFQKKIEFFENSEVRFSSKLYLMKPENLSKEDFEDYLLLQLYENYPQLEYFQNLANEINEKYYEDDPDRQIRFNPSFTWNRDETAVTKIGIRATNSCVSAKKEKEKGDEEWIKYREELLEQYGLKYEFDVKSSVPRVTYLLTNGKWLDNDIDLYKIMFDKYVEIEPSEYMEWGEEARKIYKYFFMRGYFDSYNMLAAHVKRAISLKGKYDKGEWKGLDKVLYNYKKSIEETIGELKYDSEIFFHESCIYMKVLKVLLEKGYDVLQIYDGFYTDKECKEIEKIVKAKALEYYVGISQYKECKRNIVKKREEENKKSNYKRTIVKKFTFEDFLEELEADALDLFEDEDYAYDYEFADEEDTG